MRLSFRRVSLFLRTKSVELLRLRASPHEIGYGFAVGVFIGIFPTFGFGALLTVGLAVFMKYNVPAAMIGALAGNPITTPFWIVLTCLLVGIDVNAVRTPDGSLSTTVWHYAGLAVRYTAGNAIISLVLSVASYYAVRRAVTSYRRRHPFRQP